MNVVIVGCSLAGISLALGLISKDAVITVDIVEKNNVLDRRGATFGLAPNGKIALQEICPQVLEYLQAVGIAMEKWDGFMLPWWEVRDSLLKEARKHSDRISIHMGLQVQNVNELEDHIEVTFQDSDLLLRGSVLIGADGVRSYIRTKVLGLAPAVPSGAMTWRGSTNVKEIPSLSHLVDIGIGRIDNFGSKLLLFIFNFNETEPGSIAWTASSKEPGIVPGVTTPLDLLDQYLLESNDDDNEMGATRSKAEEAKLLFANSLASDLTSCSEISVVDLNSGWGGKGRITLIGDAAHAIRPTSGLGGAMAFEDAVILSRMLTSWNSNSSSASTAGDDHDAGTIMSTLRKFEAKRFPRVKNISDDQTMRAEMAYKKDVSILPWTDEYRAWIHEGPDAPSDPPLSRDESSAGGVVGD
jgi:2-polyprenyl-6-methoxyphenol hydroxylase-like FAD-dependent oxidoreductase